MVVTRGIKTTFTIFTTILATVFVIVVLGYFLMKYTNTSDPIDYSATLDEFEWSEGPSLVHMRTASGANATGMNSGDYIVSTDGKISTYLQATSFEAVSPTELLISGRTNVFDISERVETPFYYITSSEVQSINTSEHELFNISLSPSRNYLKYTVDKKICVADFDFVTLGECTDMRLIIPDTWDWSTYFIDGEWDKENDVYVLRIRSTEIYDEVENQFENMPPERIQREVARYAYNPATHTIEALPLDSTITLKVYLRPKTAAEQSRLEQQGYNILLDAAGGTIGIEQASSGKKAKLLDAPYFGDMPGFDLYYY